MKQLLLVILISFTFSLNAQNVMNLYNMRHIPQVVNANPAFIPLGRLNISIPGLGSTYAEAGKSNFVTKDVADVDDNGTLRLDVDKFLNGLSDSNLVYAGTTIEALHIGFSVKKNYFFLASVEKLNGQFLFPKSAAILITDVFNEKGLPDIYREIEDVKIQYNHVREISFGWSRRVNKNLNIGARVKMLTGIANVQTNSTAIVIEGTTPDNDLAGLIDINMRTSGIEDYRVIKESGDWINIVSPYDNTGYAFDFGFDYRINPKMKVAASVIDLLGTITWKENVTNYIAEDVRVDFNTVSWASLIGGNGTALEGIYDSIVENVPPELVNASYETYTPTKALVSYTYYLTPKIEATIIGQGIFGQDFFEPKLRIAIQGRVKRFLNYMISYAVIDDQEDIKNLGLGLAFNFGPIQIHALTDNIFDPYIFSSTLNPSLRVGMNLTIGRDYE